ncbi:MAG TPA: VWA domain-containing protein [Acidobacteriaceae bacterium]|jgi:VWFA-related protein
MARDWIARLGFVALLITLAVCEPRLAAQTADESEGLMHIDVAVANTAGQPVIGLKAGDFALLDDGRPTKILSFHGYGEGGGELSAGITLVLDTIKLPKNMEALEREQVEKFLGQDGGHLSQPIELLMLTDDGLWRVGTPSADGGALVNALIHNRVTSWTGDNWAAHIDESWEQSHAANLNTGGTLQIHNPAGPPAESALRTLGEIAAVERRKPGRKLLIWVGPGWGAGSGVNPEEMAKTSQERLAAFDRIVWFSTLLRLARVRLCNVTPGEERAQPSGSEGLQRIAAEYGIWPAAGLEESGLRGVGSPLELDPQDRESIVELNRRALATESGGETIDGSDAANPIGGCERDAHAVYTLTFNPGPADHADEYHALTVQMRGSGLTAKTNTGYYDEPYYSDAANPALRRVTVAELNELLRGAGDRSEGELARELAGLELTERPSAEQVDRWSAELRGKKAREALVALADLAAFLDPPATEIPGDPPPDDEAQRKMIALATEYVRQTIPRLPNFFARRTAVNYQETPAYYRGNGRFSAAAPLHTVDTSSTAVVFRNGVEVVDAKVLEREKKLGTLNTYGTFGPVLGAVESALANAGDLRWKGWEKGRGGGVRGVFRYSIPATASHSETGGCCLPDGDGRIGFQKRTAYHGEIAVDPANGAVMRVVVEGDLTGFVPLDRADIVVDYGLVTIGDITYICPLRSVSLWRARSVTALAEWNTESFALWGPYATKLNDFHFDNYHLFRAKVRILPGVADVPH